MASAKTIKLRVLDHTGDTVLEAKPGDAAAVQALMDRFNDLVKNHKYMAYKVMPDGSKSATKKFDPTATETILHTQLIGG